MTGQYKDDADVQKYQSILSVKEYTSDIIASQFGKEALNAEAELFKQQLGIILKFICDEFIRILQDVALFCLLPTPK